MLLFRAIIKPRFSWLDQVLPMKDDRLPKIVLLSQPSRAKQKTACPYQGLEGVINKDLKEMGLPGMV